MRVCHITSVHSLTDGRIFEKECCSLAKQGHEVYLVGVGDTEKKQGVNIVGVNAKRKGRIYRYLYLDKLILKKALELKCDLYHIHDPELLKYVSKIKRHGHKVVFDSHEDVPRQIYSKYWIPLFLRGIVSGIYEKYEKKVCQKVDCVIAATDKIRDIFLQYGIKSVTIFNYPILGEETRTSKIDNNVLCFAGGLSQSNGIVELIDAVRDLDRVYLKLAGKFEPAIENYFVNNKNERMEYLGVLSKKEVEDLYLSSSVGVVVDLPTGNNIDGLPIKLFEFMKFGLPIITSDFPLRRAIFKKYECGKLVNPSDIESYKKAICDMLNDIDYKRACSDNGVKAVHREYNWENEEIKLKNLYEELI